MKTAANSYTQKTQFLILKEQFLFFHLLEKLFEAGIFKKSRQLESGFIDKQLFIEVDIRNFVRLNDVFVVHANDNICILLLYQAESCCTDRKANHSRKKN